MLTAIVHSTRCTVLARDSAKTDGPFVCPGCSEEVLLHKGNIRIHHFQHKPPVTCARGKGESPLHYEVKLSIFDALRYEANVASVELEKCLGSSIADVFAVINGVPVAIEVQRSTLSVNEITARTENYRTLGIAVLWVALPSDDVLATKCSPSAWEKWLHAAYYGRVYYWQRGQTLLPVHFADHKLDVPLSSWYESGGVERTAGGYSRRSKRYRRPLPSKLVDISRSFSPVNRAIYQQGSISVPACCLYLDSQLKWW